MFFQSGRSIGFDLERGDNPLGLGTRTITNIAGSVTLPIQRDIKIQNQVDYLKRPLSPITGGLAAIASMIHKGQVVQWHYQMINAPNKLTDAELNTRG